MSNNLLGNLKSNQRFMSKTEQKIANEILAQPKQVILFSLQEFAEKTGVSQGSIINFSRKFAGGGFPELKLQISACIATATEKTPDNRRDAEPLKAVLSETIESCLVAFSNTEHSNNEETMQQVVQKIINAKKVEIYGVYRSAAVATDFCYQLLELGIPASFVGDILTCAMSASMLDDESVVIAISSSGKTKDIIDAVNNAKENNVPIISITSHESTPLAKISDYVLLASLSGNKQVNSAVEIRSSQLLLTDAICTYIRNSIKTINESRYQKFIKILDSHNVDEVDDD